MHPGPRPDADLMTIFIAATLIAGLLIGGLIGFVVAVVIAAGLVAFVSGMYARGGRTI